MRKSAKRGEPQIFLLCVTLWASGGGVIYLQCLRRLAVPGPEAKNNARHLGLDTSEGVLRPSFSTAKAQYTEPGRKKAVTRS